MLIYEMPLHAPLKSCYFKWKKKTDRETNGCSIYEVMYIYTSSVSIYVWSYENDVKYDKCAHN